MKKFKFIFFICLIVLVSITFYLERTNNLSFEVVDEVYSEEDINKAVKLESAVIDKGMISEEDVTTKVLNDDNTLNLNIPSLSNDNNKSTINLKLNNSYSNKKINMEIKCNSNSDYISVYPDKNNYIIDENKDANVLITVELNDNVYSNMNIDFQCEIVSSILDNNL